MRIHCFTLGRRALLFAGLWIAASIPSPARLRLENGVLWNGSEEFSIRGVTYENGTPVQPCLYARDLPLIAAMGANTIRTYGLLPEGEDAFLSVLRTTGLHWLADFPLEPFYDPSRSILSKKAEILAAFQRYTSRFRDQSQLIGYVFGREVAEDYQYKFAGPPAEFYAVLGDAAAILAETGQEDAPLLATVIREQSVLETAPPGLSFWFWHAPPGASLSGPAGKPVLISLSGAGEQDEAIQADAAVALASGNEASGLALGGIYGAFRELFHASATERIGFDSLQPRLVFQALASLWGKGPLDFPGPEQRPRLDTVKNAASHGLLSSPGALVRITGSALAGDADPAANPWALHTGTTCLCVGENAAPIVSRSAETLVAQVPWAAQPGEGQVVLYRAGQASNFLPAGIAGFAPGIFEGAVLRAGTGCVASPGNGIHPGEFLEIYGTGLGQGTSLQPLPEAFVNSTPAKVLYAGLVPSFVGLNQVNVQVDPATSPSRSSRLELRMDGFSSNPYPLTVLGPLDRPGISLASSGAEILLQAGGPGVVTQIDVEGKDGYCGPVLFSGEDLPPGVSFRAPVAFAGQAVPLEIRAGPSAQAIEHGSLVLYGYAGGVLSGRVTLRYTVLPGLGQIPVRVISGGYKASPLARFDWNGRTLFATAGGGPGRGVNALAIDPATGVFGSVQSFDTWGDPAASDRLAQYLFGLPDGAIVLFAVADDGSLLLSSSARTTIRNLFGSRLIGTLEYQQSWAMIGRKGAATPLAEGLTTEQHVVLERVLKIPMP